MLQGMSIIEGLNQVQLIIKKNDLFPGRSAGGPNLDYMRIITTANLDFETYIENMTNEDLKDLRGY